MSNKTKKQLMDELKAAKAENVTLKRELEETVKAEELYQQSIKKRDEQLEQMQAKVKILNDDVKECENSIRLLRAERTGLENAKNKAINEGMGWKAKYEMLNSMSVWQFIFHKK